MDLRAASWSLEGLLAHRGELLFQRGDLLRLLLEGDLVLGLRGLEAGAVGLGRAQTHGDALERVAQALLHGAGIVLGGRVDQEERQNEKNWFFS